MKITTLLENTRLAGRRDLTPRHGLSLHIEHAELKILFDFGPSQDFSRNAKTLGISLDAVDIGVLSHHHIDHGGGLPIFFQSNRKAQVYLRPALNDGQYMKILGRSEYVGLPAGLLCEQSERFEFINDGSEITPGVYLIGKIDDRYATPRGNRRLFVKEHGRLVLDSFDHELLMVISLDGELVVFTGCSHHGILNMLSTVVTRFPNTPIKAVFGGFHLIDIPFWRPLASSPREVAQMGAEILKYPVEKIYTGHCTGSKGYHLLKDVMGEKLDALATGKIITLQ